VVGGDLPYPPDSTYCPSSSFKPRAGVQSTTARPCTIAHPTATSLGNELFASPHAALYFPPPDPFAPPRRLDPRPPLPPRPMFNSNRGSDPPSRSEEQPRACSNINLQNRAGSNRSLSNFQGVVGIGHQRPPAAVLVNASILRRVVNGIFNLRPRPTRAAKDKISVFNSDSPAPARSSLKSPAGQSFTPTCARTWHLSCQPFSHTLCDFHRGNGSATSARGIRMPSPDHQREEHQQKKKTTVPSVVPNRKTR